MGIEPTWDFVEPHLGFEDQERHQVALRLRHGPRCLRLSRKTLLQHLLCASRQVHL